MADELTIKIVEECVLEKPYVYIPGDLAEWFDCRHDSPSVDPFSTLRRSVGRGYVYCLLCSRRWEEKAEDKEIPVISVEESLGW